MDISFENKKVKLNILSATQGPSRDENCFAIDLIYLIQESEDKSLPLPLIKQPMLSSILWERCLKPLSTKLDYTEQSFEKIFHDELFLQESIGVEFVSLKSPNSIAELSFKEIFADELRFLSDHGEDACLRNDKIEVLIDKENANE